MAFNTTPTLWTILLCTMWLPASDAVTYTWPFPSSVMVVSQNGGSWYSHNLTLGTITINDPNITSTTTLEEASQLPGGNPNSNAHYGIFYALRPEVTNIGQAGLWYNEQSLPKETLFVEAARILTESFSGRTIWVQDQWGSGGDGVTCVGAALGPNSLQSAKPWSWAELQSKLWNPGGGNVDSWCLAAPPANAWCAMKTPSLTLNFGTITLTEASIASASATTQVECTAGMKYTLTLRGQDTIPLANGMYANLTADSRPLGSTLNGEIGLNTVQLGATLTGVPTSGNLAGTSVLLVGYP